MILPFKYTILEVHLECTSGEVGPCISDAGSVLPVSRTTCQLYISQNLTIPGVYSRCTYTRSTLGVKSKMFDHCLFNISDKIKCLCIVLDTKKYENITITEFTRSTPQVQLYSKCTSSTLEGKYSRSILGVHSKCTMKSIIRKYNAQLSG